MRDPNRIGYILDQIKEQWGKYPEFRLGQLIYCAVCPKDPCPEISGIEDEVLLNRIVKLVKTHSESGSSSQRQHDSE